MKKFLLCAFAAAMTMTASALEIKVRPSGVSTEDIISTPMSHATTFKEKYNLDHELNVQKSLTLPSLPTLRAPGTRSGDGMISDPQGTKTRYAMATDIYLSDLGSTHIGGFGAEAFISDDKGSFFSKAFTLNYYQQGYSAGDVMGDSIVFHSGQYIYDTRDNEKAYMYAAYLEEGESWPEIVDTFVLTKDDSGRYISAPGYYFIVMTEEEAEGGINEETDIICFGFNYVFTPLPPNLTEERMPADAEVFECQFLANSLSDLGDNVMKDIKVGVSGNKVYISGLTDYLPECQLVGEITDGNTVVFNSHQYIGYYDEGDYPYIYEFAMVNPIYCDGESLYFNEVDSATMTFNEEKTTLKFEDEAGIFINAYADIRSWNEVYWNIMLGNFNGAATPQGPKNVACYGNSDAPYITFEWDNTSAEGMPMNTANLWCELIINGENYIISPEHYDGLEESTEKIFFNTSGVEGLYTGEWTTIYLYEFKDKPEALKSIGVRIGYQHNDGTTYTDIVYATGYEPFEDKAFVPSKPAEVVYYKNYVNEIQFKFDGKDIDGNVIPPRILGVEILIDGEALKFNYDDYYFEGGSENEEVTRIGLKKNTPNYTTWLVGTQDGKYNLSLAGHDEIMEFQTLAIRPVCTGGGTVTYGECCEINLARPAIPANPWKVAFDTEMKEFKFGALPVDTNGDGLAPKNYGYEIYVNDALYQFNAESYELENDTILIPYGGFNDNYHFSLGSDYFYDETDWSINDWEVAMTIDMNVEEELDIQKIGVRAVYTDGDGHTSYSEIINSDGTTGTSGIDGISTDDEETKWYNLQGIEISKPEPGSVCLRRQGGTTTKVYVK